RDGFAAACACPPVIDDHVTDGVDGARLQRHTLLRYTHQRLLNHEHVATAYQQRVRPAARVGGVGARCLDRRLQRQEVILYVGRTTGHSPGLVGTRVGVGNDGVEVQVV